MDYIFEKQIFGRIVKYRCPKCNNNLESPMKEVGTQQGCPVCYTRFTVPGEEVIAAEKAAAHEGEIARINEEAIHARRDEEIKVRKAAEEAYKRSTEAPSIPTPSAPPPRPTNLVWYGKMHCNSCGYQWNARRQQPPARCASCSSRQIVVVQEPKKMQGCLVPLAFYIGAAAAMSALAWRLVAVLV